MNFCRRGTAFWWLPYRALAQRRESNRQWFCSGIHRVYGERSRADSFLDGHGTEKGDAAQSLRYLDPIYTDCTGGNSSASTSSTSFSSREERHR
ncbi:hypothetical protein CsSME_00051661 [Camellia sinensis var. sinensis]